MRLARSSIFVLATVVGVFSTGMPSADGQLRWGAPRREDIEVRLVALAVAYPRSSFFSNDEVFVAEQELAKEESRFIKLVYDFLPYQSPLSSSGLDYSLVHKVTAIRDASCDENLWEMRSLMDARRQSRQADAGWKYALQCPTYDLDHRQARLRCYRTTSDDYKKAVYQPTNEYPY